MIPQLFQKRHIAYEKDEFRKKLKGDKRICEKREKK